jgi:hypothetical protein
MGFEFTTQLKAWGLIPSIGRLPYHELEYDNGLWFQILIDEILLLQTSHAFHENSENTLK